MSFWGLDAGVIGGRGRFLVGTPLLRRPEGRSLVISESIGKTNVKLRGVIGEWYRWTGVGVSDASERRPYGHDRKEPKIRAAKARNDKHQPGARIGWPPCGPDASGEASLRA